MNSILTQSPILITGGGGFIGANLVHQLVKLNYQVNLILKKSTNLWRLKNIFSKIRIYEVDLLDKPRLTKVVKKIKPLVIYHLAAYGAYAHQKNVDLMLKTNILGSLNLLLACKNLPFSCFVNTGTSLEYGRKETLMKEKSLCKPETFYAATKLSGTVLAQVFAKKYHKPIVTFRPFSVYGPFEEKTRFIPSIINCLLKKKPIRLTTGVIRHDFIYVDDVVETYLKVLAKKDKIEGEILNIGTGKEYTNEEVVKILFQVAGEKVPIQKGAYPKRPWDNPHWTADISQAKKLLNWQPKISLKKGLSKTFTWYLKNKKNYEK